MNKNGQMVGEMGRRMDRRVDGQRAGWWAYGQVDIWMMNGQMGNMWMNDG